jgi:hypothetical protein
MSGGCNQKIPLLTFTMAHQQLGPNAPPTVSAAAFVFEVQIAFGGHDELASPASANFLVLHPVMQQLLLEK